jgi:histidyl-tRNA synthetase
MYRYEAPQKGRLREFYQLSVEMFGSDMPEADAEVVNCALDCLRAFGLSENEFVLKINNRKLLEGLVVSIAGKDELEEIVRLIDKRPKISEKEFVDALLDLSLDQEQAEKIKGISEIRGKPSDVVAKLVSMKLPDEAEQGLEELEAMLPLVPEEFVTIDLSLARGLAYYTGNVFEVFDAQGELRAILGGGRYDNLVELFGGNSEPATGFAIGYCTLLLLLTKTGKLPKAAVGPDYYIAIPEEKQCFKARELARKLRAKGSSVITDIMGRKLDKQLKYANAIGAKNLIVLGPQELASGVVKVKDMATGNEETKSLDSF